MIYIFNANNWHVYKNVLNHMIIGGEVIEETTKLYIYNCQECHCLKDHNAPLASQVRVHENITSYELQVSQWEFILIKVQVSQGEW